MDDSTRWLRALSGRGGLVGLIVSVTLTGCGSTSKTATTDTSTAPQIPPAYVDALGVHVPLTAAQFARIARDVATSRREAARAPDLFSPVLDIELSWRPGDRVGSVRVQYTYKCSAADMGYEEVELSTDGRERVVQPTTLSTDPNAGQLCATK